MDAIKKALGLDLPTSTGGLTLAALGMLLVAGIAVPLVWTFGGPVRLTGFCVAAAIFMMAAMFAGAGIYMSRMEAGRLRQMLAGEYWAHWNYTSEEVQQFLEHEGARTQRDMRFSFFFAIVFGLVVGVLMGLLTRSLLYGLLPGGFAFLLGIALVLQDSSKGQAFVFPGAGGQEVYLGQAGVYQPGRFCSFAFLTDVKLDSDNAPQTLLFYIETSAYTYRSRSTRQLTTAINTDPVRVGVPIGHEAEAEQLVTRFKAGPAEGTQTAV